MFQQSEDFMSYSKVSAILPSCGRGSSKTIGQLCMYVMLSWSDFIQFQTTEKYFSSSYINRPWWLISLSCSH